MTFLDILLGTGPANPHPSGPAGPRPAEPPRPSTPPDKATGPTYPDPPLPPPPPPGPPTPAAGHPVPHPDPVQPEPDSPPPPPRYAARGSYVTHADELWRVDDRYDSSAVHMACGRRHVDYRLGWRSRSKTRVPGCQVEVHA